MASTRAQQGNLIAAAATNGFRDQVVGSLLAYSIAVLFEGAAIVNHVNRLALARAVVQAPQSQATVMLPGYLQSANILAAAGTPASIADVDVDAETSTLFNFYANLYASQLAYGPALQVGS
jgi:hypothetical protein